MFRKLATFEEAKQLIWQTLQPKPLGTEQIPLLEAHNRVLAQDATSTLDIPPFSRSTVDGYAVKAQDTFGADENQPVQLKVCGLVSIGEPPMVKVEKGEAAEIVTGAPIPEGADAVVMVEDTQREDMELTVYGSVTQNENVMKKGTDIKQGETVLQAGRVLGSREVGVLAAVGNAQVKVHVAPTAAVLSTGGEVTEPGKPLPSGKIYDINAYSLCTAVWESGGKPIYQGVVPDEKEPLRQALKQALASADMVLTSGGVSVGPKDIIPATVDSLGEPGVFLSGVAVKPGKPTTVALIGEKPVFSFPGHPTSALLNFILLARPIIQVMAGKQPTEMPSISAVADRRMFSAKGRRTFVTVRLVLDTEKGLVAEPVESGASGAITTLAKADGFVEIPANEQFVDAGEKVRVCLFREGT
ncbi:MAG: molybdopterin-binding protein [Candidatus Bathyarchaeota archaeon]|nr:molybdopterin-binding protein [Candidatus Bathyarchaeota archaeon]